MLVYLGCLVFGGLLLAASVGGAGADHDLDHGADVHGHAESPLLPFLSLRFWLFTLAFFGLTGTVLSSVGIGGAVVPAVSAGVGLISGYGAARVLRSLGRSPVGLLPGADAHVGREGKALLPVARGQRGKIRLVASGIASDFLAETDDDRPIAAGHQVLVVGVRGNVLLVERAPVEPPDLALPAPGSNKETL